MKRQYFDMLSTTAVYVKLRVQLYTMLIHHGYAHMQCRDTYWVESFNHQLLTYLSKRIHFSTPTYRMRMNLAVLDWVCFPYLLITCTLEHVYVCSYRMRMCYGLRQANGCTRISEDQTDEHQSESWLLKPSNL